MKTYKLLLASCMAAVTLLLSCSKYKDQTTTTAGLTQYYIAGKYGGGFPGNTQTIPLPYALLMRDGGQAIFVDAVFGQVKGTYTLSNESLVFNFGTGLNATFTFQVNNNVITKATDIDGLPLISYNLEQIPSQNVFSGGKYAGSITNNQGISYDYAAFSDSKYALSSSGYQTPGVAYTLLNNAVAVFQNGAGFYLYDNGAVQTEYYVSTSDVTSIFYYGTLIKQP